jgi:hypothetical protein
MASKKLLARSRYYAKKYPNTHIRGFEQVMNNLNAELSKMHYKSVRGAVNAVAFIRNDTEKTPYITPLDKGNLRASWFCVSREGAEPDPIGKSGHFRKLGNRWSVAQFQSWHSDAKMEAKALTKGMPDVDLVVFGYSVIYAMWAHEMFGKHFKRPSSGPKWFQDSMDRNQKKILQIIRETLKMPGTK